VRPRQPEEGLDQQRAISRRQVARLEQHLPALQAQVVGAALEHARAQLSVFAIAQGALHQRQVLLEQLILERRRRGGHNHSATRADRVQRGREQIRQALAGASARLDQQPRARV
jgi:hypothetical protein